MEKIKLLIVEDDQSIAALYNKYLPDDIFEKILIASGEAALKIYQNKRPDVMILDMILPGISGGEVLHTIRETHADADLPVIVSTAVSRERDVQDFVHMGIQGYIIKPFNNKELCEKVLEGYGRTNPGRAEAALKLLHERM
ncbi:PleD family two-component system response regulator [Thermodesulfobacteriota bacterium]